MSFAGDFQVRFHCRGAAFDLSPAFQRRERRYLDLPVAERRLSEGSQEQRAQSPCSHVEIVRRRCRSTVAPRLMGIIARIPALKRQWRSVSDKTLEIMRLIGNNNSMNKKTNSKFSLVCDTS